jgi:hypothetical protein
MLAALINQAHEMGYEITLGEVWRTEEQAALNAKKGIGIKNSLHRSRLAVDLNFFSGGQLIPPPESVGSYWESQGGSWGGRFGDPAHFSLAHEGRK